MADEDCEGTSHNVEFDETLLFKEFDAEGTKRDTKIVEETGTSELKALQQENELLKAALRKVTSYKSKCPAHTSEPPLVQVLYFDNKESRRSKQHLEDFLQSLSSRSEDKEEPDCLGRDNFQPSIFDLDASRSVVDDESQSETDYSRVSFISSVRYFDVFCIDCTGFPLIDLNPTYTGGWTIPVYEQTFLRVLPCGNETPKVRIRQRKKCFNCDGEGHNVQDCPEPQNQGKISANRREFMNKFSSPFSKEARYHVENERRFGHFKAGVISDKLREALGVKETELPIHIYRMRRLGYPPAYVPTSGTPSLLIYDGDGNVDNYVMEEEESEGSEDLPSQFISYPGFNTPLPEGVVDKAWELGMPPMQEWQQLNNIVSYHRQSRRFHENSSGGKVQLLKRKRSEPNRQEQDMELEDQGENIPLEIGSPQDKINGDLPQKRGRYEDSGSDGGGYSPAHPGVECGKAEMELLKRYRRRSAEHKDRAPLPASPPPQRPPLPDGPAAGKRRRSREEGELVSGDEEEGEEEEEEKEEEEEAPQRTPEFWLKEPLVQTQDKERKPRPPPKPPVVLPMDALTRFYTSCTVLQKMSFEDRVMWLDPVYGNVQVVSGRYEKLKKILGKKSSRR